MKLQIRALNMVTIAIALLSLAGCASVSTPSDSYEVDHSHDYIPHRDIGAQPVTFAQFQRDRPVLPQVGVRAIEEPERGYHQYRATPLSERREVIVREPEPRCEQIDDWQQKTTLNDNGHQSLFQRIRPAYNLLIALRAVLKHTANGHVNNETNEKNKIPRLNSHVLVRHTHACWYECQITTKPSAAPGAGGRPAWPWLRPQFMEFHALMSVSACAANWRVERVKGIESTT